METKTCTKCGFTCATEDAPQYFHHHAGKPGGYDYACKACRCARQNAYRRAHLDQERARNRRYHQDKFVAHYHALLSEVEP